MRIWIVKPKDARAIDFQCIRAILLNFTLKFTSPPSSLSFSAVHKTQIFLCRNPSRAFGIHFDGKVKYGSYKRFDQTVCLTRRGGKTDLGKRPVAMVLSVASHKYHAIVFKVICTKTTTKNTGVTKLQTYSTFLAKEFWLGLYRFRMKRWSLP